MRTFRFAVPSILVMFFCIGNAYAELIIETSSDWNGTRGVGNLAPGEVWGQTFTAPTNAIELSASSIWVQAYPVDNYNLGPYDLDITAYLMAWTGSRAAQPILTSSLSSGSVSPFGMTRIDFDFQDALVTPGSEYVIFFEISPSTTINYALFGYVGEGHYDGGGFGGPYGASFSNLTTRNWTIGTDDLAFELKFTSVPELASFGMTGMVIVVFALFMSVSRFCVPRRQS